MSPCVTDSAIAEFVQGLSTPAEAQAIEAHVAQCSNCRQVLSRASALLLSVSGAAPLAQTIANARQPAPPLPRRRTRVLVLGLATLALAGVAGALLLSRARQAATAAPPALAVLDAGSGWQGAAVAELLRASLGSDGTARVVDGDTSARAARELGAAVPAQLSATAASAWQRRLGVEQLILVATETQASGRIAVTLALWPAATAPLREVGTEDELSALAVRLDARLRAAWRRPAPPTSAALLPSGAALRPYAEGLLSHRQGDEAGALARWTQAAQLAPEHAVLLTSLAEALIALGRPRAARPVAARAVAQAASLPAPWRQRIEARARLAAGDVAGALPLVRDGAADEPALARALVEAQRASGDVKGAAATLALARARPLVADEAAALDLEAARLALSAGDGAGGRRWAQAAAQVATARGATTLLVASRRVESAACLLLGDVAQARQVAADAVAGAAAPGVDGGEGIDALLALGVAQLASRAGGPAADAAAAETSFTQALARARAQERLDRAARSLGDLAALAARAGQRDVAARWLEQLAETARQAEEPEAEAAARRERATLLR